MSEEKYWCDVCKKELLPTDSAAGYYCATCPKSKQGHFQCLHKKYVSEVDRSRCRACGAEYLWEEHESTALHLSFR